jgi:hypothetical protein
MGTEDINKTTLVNRVEDFTKINLEHNSRLFAKIAAPYKVDSIDDILRDASAREETRLVGVDKGVNRVLKARGEGLSDHL